MRYECLNPVAIDRELVKKGGLYDFVQMAWSVIEPSPFVPNWHLEEICTHLEAVSRYEITDLVINIPPGTGKSLIAGVFWPAWEWIKLDPTSRFIYMSYDSTLTARDAGRQIKLMTSDWFYERWGNQLEKTKPADSNFSNRSGGFRFSSSIGGKVTGRHGNKKVVDDPIKPLDAEGGQRVTKAALKKVSRWYGGTMASRVQDHTRNANVVIMQRLHEEDLAGECIASGNYVHLCFPMRFERDRACKTPWGGDRRTTEGELLFPARIPGDAVTKQEERMGPDVAAAQLQQRPVRPGGNIFKAQWWRHWDPATLPKSGLQIQSWDCAFKGNEDSDFVCGGVWLASYPNFYLIWLVNDRLEFTDTLEAIKEFRRLFPNAYDILIEDKANGPAVENMLRAEVHGIEMVNPMGGKEARARSVTGLFKAGRVLIPPVGMFPWVSQYMRQHESFPRGVNDDMVDMSSQALIKLRSYSDALPAAMAALRGE